MRCCSCFSKNQLESASLLLAVWLAPNTVVIPTYSRQVCHSSVCHPVFLNDSQNLSRLFHCLVINVHLLSFLATALIFYHLSVALSTTFFKKLQFHILADIKRRRRDLNPRAGHPTYTLSRGTSSAT